MSFSPTVFAGIQLFSGIAQASAQKQEAEVRAIGQESAASAELFNADVLRQEAKLAQSKAKIEVSRQKRDREKLMGEQQVLFAKSGVRTDVGTPLLVMQETFEEAELDILITEFNAQVEEDRKISEARQAELRAGQRRDIAKQERAAGSIRAGATLLETATTFGKKFIGE